MKVYKGDVSDCCLMPYEQFLPYHDEMQLMMMPLCPRPIRFIVLDH